jgi:predicted  nucleic acid-binding Zn-ribbon protein
MPALEERLEMLERALSAMKLEHIYDVRQLDERITALHEQIAEQRKRLSEQEQAIGRLEQTIDTKFDGLMKVMVQHSNALNARMDAQDSYLHQNFAAIDARFTRLEDQINQQTIEIKAKFETSDFYATRTWGVVQSQEQYLSPA